MNQYKKDLIKAFAFIFFISFCLFFSILFLSEALFKLTHRISENERALKRIEAYDEKILKERADKKTRLKEYYESKNKGE